jgi:hypothetical protein
MDRWTRAEKIALYSLLVAILGIVAGIFVREIRRSLHLNPEVSLQPVSSVSQFQSSILPKAFAKTSNEVHQSTSTDTRDPSNEMEPGYFVIGLCSQDRAIALQESERENARGVSTNVINSSDWSNLLSGWYVVVYGIYADKLDAIMAQKEIETRGIKAYVKHSGARIH